MRKQSNVLLFAIIILVVIGLFSQVIGHYSQLIIPVGIIGLIVVAYATQRWWLKKRLRAKQRKAKKTYPFRIIQGGKNDKQMFH